MESLFIPSEVRTPKIDFNWQAGVFSIRGESYPEDVRKFYDYPIRLFRDWLNAINTGSVVFEFELTYFNSSTAKVIMDLFGLIETAAARGCEVRVIWHHAADDDNLRELGEEFGSELKIAKFQLCESPN